MLRAVTILCSLGAALAEPLMLWGGTQASHLVDDISEGCDSALNTTLECPIHLQWLVSGIQTVGSDWNTSSLDLLCTDTCAQSLAGLAGKVELGCAQDTYNFNGENHTWSGQVEFFQYKYDLMCLRDRNSGEYCHNVEASWNITSMVAAGNTTWPTHTTKCYFDLARGSFETIMGDNDTCKDIFADNESPYGFHDDQYEPNPVAHDYYYDRSAAIDDDNFGWPEPLEADEYPLEIQCSLCHLDRLRHGLESQFGEPWDDVAVQVWSNIQANCNFTESINPALNFTGFDKDPSMLIPNNTVDLSLCVQQIQAQDGDSCTKLAIDYSVPSAALQALNPDEYCPHLDDAMLCAPPRCPVGLHADSNLPLSTFLNSYANFTSVQFFSWNPLIRADVIRTGDVVCVGPSKISWPPVAETPA